MIIFLQVLLNICARYHDVEVFPLVPVIATDIGEISDMISSADGVKAGFTLKLNSSGRVDTDNLAECMKAYLDDEMLYNKHKVLTKKAILKFDMKKCVINYKKLYKESFQSKN